MDLNMDKQMQLIANRSYKKSVLFKNFPLMTPACDVTLLVPPPNFTFETSPVFLVLKTTPAIYFFSPDPK